MQTMEPREILTISIPNKGWVVSKLDELRRDWAAWLKTVQHLPDSPDYNPQTCTEAIKDGFANRSLHEILRERTLVFIGNHFTVYSFLFANWPTYPYENNIGRLASVVPSWIQRLETLSACIEYARVPDGFLKAKAKQLVEAVVKESPEKAIEIAAAYLKNPMG